MNIVKSSNTTEVILKRDKMFCGDVGVCPRKAVLHLYLDDKVYDTFSMTSDLYMGIGTAVHKVITDHLKKQEVLLASEYHIVDNRVGPPMYKAIGGYIDDIIEYEDQLAIVEVKTCGDLPQKVKLWHEMQAATYMVLSGIDIAFVHYVSRKVATFRDILQVSFRIDNSKIDIAANNLAEAHVYANEGALPEKPSYMNLRSKCGFCPFIPYCWDHRNSIVSREIKTPSKTIGRKVSALKKELINGRKNIAKTLRESLSKKGSF